jgi:RimJ/RimL family protein N-acetyltransferase
LKGSTGSTGSAGSAGSESQNPGTTLIACGLCVLRPWHVNDLESLVRHADDREVWLMLRDRFPHPYTIEAGRAWLAAASVEDPPTALAIDVGGEAVGGIGVIAGADVNRHAGEIGYWLGRAWWGRGLATASVTHFVPWVARTFGFARLFAQAFETNLASMRVLEKCGFQREGILRSHAQKDGRYLDEVVYGIVLDVLRQKAAPRQLSDTNPGPVS